MAGTGFFQKVVRGLSRDKDLALNLRLRRGYTLVSQSAVAKLALRGCTEVGPGARVSGKLRIENAGEIRIGSGFSALATHLPTELLSGPGGSIVLGDDVWLNFGTVISAAKSVRIGSHVMVGQHCIISDTSFPGLGEQGAAEALPIEIGDDAWIAGRVTIAPGVKIGAGAVVTAGSVVTTDIPAKAIAGGIPARFLRWIDPSRDGEANAASVNGHVNGAAAAPAPARTETPQHRGTLISDFTVDELVDELAAPSGLPALGAEVAPYGQVTQFLMQPPSPDAADFAVVWTRPEISIPSFARLLAYEDVDPAQLAAEVAQFTALILRAAASYKAVFVPTWVQPAWLRGRGMADGRPGGVTRALTSLNLQLMEALEGASNVFVLDAQRWLHGAGRAGHNPRGWYLGKVALPRGVMREAAADIRAAFVGLRGAAKKLLVLDLDDTLWGGIVGDAGWENLRLGGPDPQGESFADFQRAIKNLKRRGIVLALVSKNEESVALEAIRKHPEMVLKEDDFVGWRINWTDKARNIADLATELNLGLQSVVFIDDNPVERARVREALPEVFVPEWPEDKLLYASAFGQLRCFDAPAVSREDLERTRMYAEERQRDNLQKQVGSIEEWLKSLEIKVRAERLGPANLARATQLLNKTNQLNLSTRRLNEAELTAWAAAPNRGLWVVSVSDRFGDAGLTGIVSVEVEGRTARIVDYVLSCRVMGRKVEETLLHMAVSAAFGMGASQVEAHYLQTPKNKPCLTVFKASGFANEDDRVFRWNDSSSYLLPEVIHLVWDR
ncbi:MAG TPA: HAD-IIIC family phosphatase [Polyangiaceae bacterium]|nr:HAD-IIIC family phosphatase [Polyangiaceae bacterium]